MNGKRQSMPRNSVRLSLRCGENGSSAPGSSGLHDETPIKTEVIASISIPTSPTKPEGPRSPIKESVAAPFVGASPQPPPRLAQNGDSQQGPPVPTEGLELVPTLTKMERRRRQRILARAQPPGMVPWGPIVAMNLNPEISSSSEGEDEAHSEEEVPEEDEEGFDTGGDADDSMEIHDEDYFHPCVLNVYFLCTHPSLLPSDFAANGAVMNSDSASESASLLSGVSTSVSSLMTSSVPPSTSARTSRLSLVREGGERPSV